MLRPSQSQSLDLLRKHVHRSIIFCQFAADKDKRLPAHGRAIAIVDIGPHDHVRHPRFIFDQKEDDPLGGLRPLPSDDQTRHLAFDAAMELLQIAVERQVGR